MAEGGAQPPDVGLRLADEGGRGQRVAVGGGRGDARQVVHVLVPGENFPARREPDGVRR